MCSTNLEDISLPQKCRIFLIGVGRMGKIRTSILYANPRVEFSGVIDMDIEGAAKLASKYSTKYFKTLTDAVSSLSDHYNPESINGHCDEIGIVVSTPTFTHESIVNEAISLKIIKYIFLEKPVDETADKISKLYKRSVENDIVLCCGFQRRFDASYVALKDSVSLNKIGKPLISTIFFADHPCPPLDFLMTGGNIFSDLAAHDIDFIRWCLNDEVCSVYATGTSSTKILENAGVHDNATMVMKFKKGAVVTLNLSRSASYGYDQRCEIFGDSGLLTLQNEYHNTSTLSNKDGVHHSLLKRSFPQRFKEAFISELDAFVDVILSEREWPISKNDCISVQRVSDAAKKSCELGEVVELQLT